MECGELVFFFFQAEDGIRDVAVTGVQTCALPIWVTDGRTAFDTSGWGPPGHYPAWLPAYCAQAVGRDTLGQVRYQLLESGRGDLIVDQLRTMTDAGEPPQE